MFLNRNNAYALFVLTFTIFFGGNFSPASAQKINEEELIIPKTVGCDKLWKPEDSSPPTFCPLEEKVINGVNVNPTFFDKKVSSDFQSKQLLILERANHSNLKNLKLRSVSDKAQKSSPCSF